MAQQKQSPAKTLQALFSLAFVGAAAWFFLGGGLERQAATNMQAIQDRVAEDAFKQYRIAKEHGSKTDACVQAGMVSAAYLQAKDEANYKAAKSQEQLDCALAGLPVN